EGRGPRPRPERDDPALPRHRPHEADLPLPGPRLPPDRRVRQGGDRPAGVNLAFAAWEEASEVRGGALRGEDAPHPLRQPRLARGAPLTNSLPQPPPRLPPPAPPRRAPAHRAAAAAAPSPPPSSGRPRGPRSARSSTRRPGSAP